MKTTDNGYLHDRPLRLAGTAQEFTEYRTAAELEARVLARTQESTDARVRAESADRRKSDFLATLSHEMRTPLNSILGFTSLLQQQQGQLGTVRGGALHLLELINDVLSMSRIESGEIEIRADAFDLGTVLDNCVATAEPLAAAKGLKFELVVESPLGSVLSDQRGLEQILINLLNNAIKFTARGTVTQTASIAGARGDAKASARDSLLRIRIADTGIGIKAGDMKGLFAPFRQVDPGPARRQEGTGLGLAISRRLAEQMGGTLLADSNFGVGSVFTLTLPLRPGRFR